MLLDREEYGMATLPPSVVWECVGALACTYSSSIISKGGRLSNWPSSNNSPEGALLLLEGFALGDGGFQEVSPSRGLSYCDGLLG
jgi:hypothetical protein